VGRPRRAAAVATPPPAPPAGKLRVRNSYEAGSGATRRTLNWIASTLGPNASTLPSLQSLRDRAREAVRNNGVAAAVIEKLVTNAVGTGIKPMSHAVDRDFRTELLQLWDEWTEKSDADGVLDYYGQQAQAARCWYEAGEVFIRLRDRRPEDGLPVPLQVQILEPELCPHTMSAQLPGGNRVQAGIEFDAIGRRVAYYFYSQRPGDLQDWNTSDIRRVPADGVLHLYKPLRAGQLRGIPKLTGALIKLKELDKLDDATLLRHQLASMFVAFLRTSGEDSSLSFLTGQDPDTTQDGKPVVSLEPGSFNELGPGESVDFSEPPGVMTGLDGYMEQQLRTVGMACGVAYEILTGNLAAVNDRSVKVLLQEFRRMLTADQHQHLAFQFAAPLWRAWMDRVFLSGALPIPPAYLKDPRPWARAEWRPHGWPYLHPVQDVEADAAAIRNGFTSRAAIVSENGDDVEDVDQQNAYDNARADDLGLKYDSDGRQSKSGMNAAAAAQPVNDGGNPGSSEENAPPAKKKAAGGTK
jgi:lambda family phage portal protein